MMIDSYTFHAISVFVQARIDGVVQLGKRKNKTAKVGDRTSKVQP
jgi:hypothetical protein